MKTLLVVFLLVCVAEARLSSLFRDQSNCTECLDKSYCCYGELCCDGGSFCCSGNTSCCGGVCCVGGESCCGPQYGESGVCCIEQTSYCCPPTNGGKTKSRCCPRWTICCDFEDDGCCEPAALLAYQRDAALANATATAMFVRGIDGLLTSEQIEVASGAQSNELKIPAASFNTFGEATQLFMYDAGRALFYLLRANYTVAEPLPITLSTVDPSSGKCSEVLVRGAAGSVTGFDYVAALDAIVFATPLAGGAAGSYQFWRLSPPGSAQAVLLSTYVPPSDAGAVDLWTGYITAVSSDGSTAYRVGYENAQTGANPGLGTTDISTAQASTSWSAVPLPARHQFYQTASLYRSDGPSFLSLAAEQSLSGSLALVLWNRTSAVVLAQWDNAHSIPLFGSVAQCLSPDLSTFVALVAYGKRDPIYDTWQLISVDLSAPAPQSVQLQPKLNAGANPVSGLGIAVKKK